MGSRANADIFTVLLFSLPIAAVAILTLHMARFQILTAFI